MTRRRATRPVMRFLAVLFALAACTSPARSPPCEVATFLCRKVPCDDGGTSSPHNCPRLDVGCEAAKLSCARRAEVESCLAALGGATLSCPEADACFTRVGCAWIGLSPADGG